MLSALMPTGAQNFQKGKITKLNSSTEPVCDPGSLPKAPRPNVHLYRQNHGAGYAGNATTLSLNIMRHWQSHSESPPPQKRQYELAVHLRLLKITLDASQIQWKGIKEVAANQPNNTTLLRGVAAVCWGVSSTCIVSHVILTCWPPVMSAGPLERGNPKYTLDLNSESCTQTCERNVHAHTNSSNFVFWTGMTTTLLDRDYNIWSLHITGLNR